MSTAFHMPRLVPVFPDEALSAWQNKCAALLKANEALRTRNAYLESELVQVTNELAAASAIAYGRLNLDDGDSEDSGVKSTAQLPPPPPQPLPCSAEAAARAVHNTVVVPKAISVAVAAAAPAR